MAASESDSLSRPVDEANISRRGEETVTFRPVQDELQTDFDEQLDEYERLWRSDSVPDIGRFIRNAADNMPFLFDLIELDLECRWRRYDVDNPPSDDPVDEHGFPLFPRLEDYAGLEGVDATRVLTPGLAAEEYRARHLWGDRPQRNEYPPRFPDFADELDAELQQVDTDIQSEGASTPFELAESASAALNSTVEIRKDDVRHSQSDESPVPPKIDNYEILDLLGRGGFGEVWKARRIKGLSREVAIKIPRSDRRFPREVIEKFKAEGEKMAALGRIPGIVTVFDAGEIDGRPYIISDYIEGESLEDRLQRETKLPHEEAALLVADIADALHAMHKTGMVHRDIKPANILLDKDGKPHIADFGLAVSRDQLPQEMPVLVGTYQYMSPEQARSASNRVDGRSDLFSLGVILYRVLSGQLPFVGTSGPEYIDRILNDEPSPVRAIDDEISSNLESVCLKCLAKTISSRYSTARDVAHDLRSLSQSTSTQFALVAGAVLTASIVGVAIWQPWKVAEPRHTIPRNTLVKSKSKETRPRREIPQLRQVVEHKLSLRNTQLLYKTKRNVEIHNMYNTDNQTFEIDSQCESVFRVGKTDAFNYEVEVTFTNLSKERNPDPVFGVVLGYRQRMKSGTPNTFVRFQAILARIKGTHTAWIHRRLNSPLK